MISIISLLISFFLFFSSICSSTEYKSHTIEWASHSSVRCDSPLEESLSTIRQLPEAENLIQEVLKEGPLHIAVNRHMSKKFEGYWSFDNRTVYITPTSHPKEINTILFELHNAYRDKDLRTLNMQAAHRTISRAEYIRAFEYVEYLNVKDTEKMLDIGIQKGLFPRSCAMHYPDDFERHLAVQKSSGHSNWIGEIYDSYMD